MKKPVLFICIILIGFQSFSQKSRDKTYFLLTDTVFTESSYCVLPDIIFNLSGGWGIDFSSHGILDSIVLFLKKNPILIVEIGCHTDFRPIPMTNDTLSQRKAMRIVEYFIEKGIDPKRLTAKGYGEHEPRKLEKDMESRGFTFKKGTLLIPEYINSIADRKEKEAAHDLNRRTEMKILRVDAKP
ncbi:MAG: OmpA family protein [Bacteroidales bacterium]|jgi:peptidoglycan-associated lipoprotein|nr:OmpA family protein [Bacteroidales bacterium]